MNWNDLVEGDVVLASFAPSGPDNDEPVLLMLEPSGSNIRYVNLMTGIPYVGKCNEKIIEGWIVLPKEGT